ncbi:MAG: DMT family transporter [Brevibacillus sp.]|nr:DMT family transporter [Brevibacillus sp.]
MFRYVLLVFLGACSYGVLSTFVKLAYSAGFLPGEVTGSQVLIGAGLTWLPALFFIKKRVSAKQWLMLLGVGLTAGLTGVLYYTALQFVPASIGIVLLFQFTWMGVLLEAIVERKRPTSDKIAALLLLFVGTALAGDILESGWQQFTLIGLLLGLLSAVAYTLFIFFSGKVAVDVNPWIRSALIATGSALLTFVIYPPDFLINGSLFAGLFNYALPLALFGVLIPTVFFTIGVPKIGGGLATILGAAELPTAVFMSSIVLREQVSALQWFGVAIILIGIAVPEIKRTLWNKPTTKSEA